MSLDYIFFYTTHNTTHNLYKFEAIQIHVVFLPLHKKEICYEMDTRKIIILILIQTIRMEIEPCANSMWTESMINNCYTSQMERTEGRVRLSLQMTLEKPYIYLQVIVSASPVNQSSWKCGET